MKNRIDIQENTRTWIIKTTFSNNKTENSIEGVMNRCAKSFNQMIYVKKKCGKYFSDRTTVSIIFKKERHMGQRF